MLDLNNMRAEIDRFEYDRTLAGTISLSLDTGDDEKWLDALRRGKLLFVVPNADKEYFFGDFTKIDFAGPENDNQEWRQQLNRFYWMEPIARACEANADEYLANAAKNTVTAWLESHPYSDVWPAPSWEYWIGSGDSTLSLSLRLGQRKHSGWWGAVPYIARGFDGALLERMHESTLAQLAYLRKNISKSTNWRVSQLDAICFLGLVLPGAKRHLAFALDGINEVFHYQVEPDGSHCEHTGDYHAWMTDVFTSYALLGKARPELGISIDSGRLVRMWDYALHQYAPDGRTLGLNDDGRWYEMAKPADVTALRAKRESVIAGLGLNPGDFPLSPTGVYPDAGQFFFRKSWAKDSPMVVYDATNFGGWHCHTGRGGIQYFDGKRMLLTDPGSLNYDGRDPFTSAGKQTLLHNTVTVDDMVQAAYSDARVHLAADLPGASAAVSTYAGGFREPYGAWGSYNTAEKSFAARHTRSMVWVKDAFVLVVDTLDCAKAFYSFRSAWQFGEGEVILTGSGARTTFGAGDVSIRAVECGTPLSCKIYCGHESPLLGYVAKDGSRLDGGVPAPMLGIEGSASDGRETVLAQIIVPYAIKTPPAISTECRQTDGAIYFKLNIGEISWHVALSRPLFSGEALAAPVGECEKIRCDGLIAAVGEIGGSVFYTFAANARRLFYDGAELIKRGRFGNYELIK